MITPLVQAARKPTEWLGMIGLYASGALSASMILGTALGWFGSVLLPAAAAPPALLVVATVGFALALADLGLLGARTPTLQRQTHPVWWRTLGPRRATFLWGFDLGLGFTTIRVGSLYWMVALVALVLRDPLVGAAVLGVYGVALTANLVIGVTVIEALPGMAHGNIVALRLLRPARAVLLAALLSWSAFLIGVSL